MHVYIAHTHIYIFLWNGYGLLERFFSRSNNFTLTLSPCDDDEAGKGDDVDDHSSFRRLSWIPWGPQIMHTASIGRDNDASRADCSIILHPSACTIQSIEFSYTTREKKTRLVVAAAVAQYSIIMWRKISFTLSLPLTLFPLHFWSRRYIPSLLCLEQPSHILKYYYKALIHTYTLGRGRERLSSIEKCSKC